MVFLVTVFCFLFPKLSLLLPSLWEATKERQSCRAYELSVKSHPLETLDFLNVPKGLCIFLLFHSWAWGVMFAFGLELSLCATGCT